MGFFKFILLILFLGCNKIAGEAVKTSQQSNSSLRPNIILILADDVGYEVPTYTGGQSYYTPNIDLMAASGIQFTQCHSTPLCSPSRVELLTGKYNFRNYNHWGILKSGERTIANYLHDAGYSTCVSGKWQLGGGDSSIHNSGFNKYSVWEPFATDSLGNETGGGSHYKNPHIYQDGVYLPNSIIHNKYGEDFFKNYVFNFIDSNQTQPYFIYWALNLCHQPFSPTPDDADFATWVNRLAVANDTIYFPSMVKYMDKEIGQLIEKVRGTNTIVIFLGDNGTDQKINSLWNNTVIKGGKGLTTKYGTHVPCIIFNAGFGVDSTMRDLTDISTTVLNITGVSYSGLDGTNDKQYLYFNFQPNPDAFPARHSIWVMDRTYKKYDTICSFPSLKNRFFNTANDPLELKYISNETLYEKSLDSQFTNVIKTIQ